MKNTAHREYLKLLLDNSFPFIKKGHNPTSLLEIEPFRLFLMNLNIYQVKHINLIMKVCKVVMSLKVPKKVEDNLYELLLENFYLDVISCLEPQQKIENNDSKNAFFLLQEIIVCYGNEIGENKSNAGLARVLGVSASRITEWGNGKKIPDYIINQANAVLNIPVWTLASRKF